MDNAMRSYAGASFAYIFMDSPHDGFSRHEHFGGGVLSLSDSLGFSRARAGSVELAVLGFCVDSHAELAEDQIAQWLASAPDAFAASGRLAGRYLILRYDGESISVIPDALCYLQVYYREVGGAFASHEKLLGDALGLRPSGLSRAVKRAARPDIAMPGGMSMYDGIRALLANHALDAGSGGVRRAHPAGPLSPLSVDEAAERIVPLVLGNARTYGAAYDIILPLTAGRDSRLNMGIMRLVDQRLECFTFTRKEFTELTADYYLPARICQSLGIPHRRVDNPAPPPAFADSMRALGGDWVTGGTITQAWAFAQLLPGKAALGGAVLDQLVRASTSQSTPDWLASPWFFFGRLGNPHPHALSEARRWLADAKAAGVSPHDLFAWESRSARWVGASIMGTALNGCVSLNLFNCREIIETIIRVDRKARHRGRLQKRLYQMIAPELLEFPFNPPRSLLKDIRGGPAYLLLSVYIGQLLRVLKYAWRRVAKR